MHQETLRALAGDPWAEAAASIPLPTSNPITNRAWAWRGMRSRAMAREVFEPDTPEWAQIRGHGWPTDGSAIRHRTHGLLDLAQGVFRRPQRT